MQVQTPYLLLFQESWPPVYIFNFMQICSAWVLKWAFSLSQGTDPHIKISDSRGCEKQLVCKKKILETLFLFMFISSFKINLSTYTITHETKEYLILFIQYSNKYLHNDQSSDYFCEGLGMLLTGGMLS